MEKRYALPSMEKEIILQSVGKETGLNWVGTFLYKRPTIAERNAIEVMKSRLNGDLSTIDPVTNYINTAIAHLRFTLRKYPDWWKDCDFGGALYDTNIIIEMYEKCVNFEKEWADKIGGDPKQLEETNGPVASVNKHAEAVQQ